MRVRDGQGGWAVATAIAGGLALALAITLAATSVPRLWWIAAIPAPFYAAGLYAARAAPRNLTALRLLVLGALFAAHSALLTVVAAVAAYSGEEPWFTPALRVADAAEWALYVLGAQTFALLPDGRAGRAARWALRPAWVLVAVPAIPAPLAGFPVPGLEPWRPLVLVYGAAILLLRYGRAPEPVRLPLRRPLVALAVTAVGGITLALGLATGLIPAGNTPPATAPFQVAALRIALDPGPGALPAAPVLWAGFYAALLVWLAAALLAALRPGSYGTAATLRRVLVYGGAWLLACGVAVALALAYGVDADVRLGVAALLGLAVMAFAWPLRERLDRLAIGRPGEPGLLEWLGETLAGTGDQRVVARVAAEGVRRGLGVRWALVRLGPLPREAIGPEPMAAGAPPYQEITVALPLRQAGEHLGRVEVGPRPGRRLSEREHALLRVFADRTARAVRNARLVAEESRRLGLARERADELAGDVAALRESRARLAADGTALRRDVAAWLRQDVQRDVAALAARVSMLRHAYPFPELDRLHRDARDALLGVRALATRVWPAELDAEGLAAAAATLAPALTAEIDLDRRLPAVLEHAAFDCLRTAAAHAHPSPVTACVRLRDDALVVDLTLPPPGTAEGPDDPTALDDAAACPDDAIGDEYAEPPRTPPPPDPDAHLPPWPWLTPLSDRMAAAGGTLDHDDRTVTARFPLPPPP
ncbi:hypothetical protein [Bailinhaonella thermotolerans]|uniref:hypothetical protein n=1 Tax=Bailinhaonella thermotolerans TaxID=1070861 RepID=UPI00192A5B82|nr:hypothetical protein [Bailinhaonella thermotolerans]